MKKTFLLYAFVITCVLSSCSSNCLYQIYEVKSDNLETKSNGLVYEDDNCLLFYNLWDKSGSLSFVFENKANKDIIIDLTRSFFIKNGMVYDYYQDQSIMNRGVFELTTSRELCSSYLNFKNKTHLWSTSLVVDSDFSISPIITKAQYFVIPAKTCKVMPGFKISNIVYKECGNNKMNYPEEQSETINYTKSNSPLTFSNRITYKLEGQGNNEYLQNDFWLSSLTNYTEETIFEKIEAEDCGNPYLTVKVNIKQAPNRFYNTYEGIDIIPPSTESTFLK